MRLPRPLPRSWKIGGALLAGGLLLLAAAVRYSESPRFCNSCHIMEPYYRAWETSAHSQVACVKCHYPPGKPKELIWKKFQALSQVAKYVTRTYSSKPFAEIEDASCLRSGCHSTRLLEGRVETKNGIKFDHRPHLSERRPGRRLRCVSCHSQVVVGKHIEVTYDTCYLCHFRGKGEGREAVPIGGCLGCHELPTKTFRVGDMDYNHEDFVTKRGLACQNCHLDVISGEGLAKRDRCFTCHNQPEKLERYGDIAFIHDNHVTEHNVACFHCHEELTHGLSSGSKAIAAGRRPERPHPPALTFDCAYCHDDMHNGQLRMYTGMAESLGLPKMPSPMYLAQVDCVGCHYGESVNGGSAYIGRTFKASEGACIKCHGDSFKGVWQETKDELTEGLDRIADKLARARAASAEKPTPPVRSRLEKAERLHRFVKAARGEHNIYLAATALRRADDALTQAGEAMGAELPDLSDQPLISGQFCATLCHERVGVNVPPDTVTHAGREMPHGMHAAMMGCAACHELGAHKRVPLKTDYKDRCASCHPE